LSCYRRMPNENLRYLTEYAINMMFFMIHNTTCKTGWKRLVCNRKLPICKDPTFEINSIRLVLIVVVR
jgi:hypothetical protein